MTAASLSPGLLAGIHKPDALSLVLIGRRLPSEALQRVSGHPLLRFNRHIHECLQVIETERGAVDQTFDWSLNGRDKVVAKLGPFWLTFCQIVDLMLPHPTMIACRLAELLVAILFPPCGTVGDFLTEGGPAPHRSQRKQEAEALTDGPERITWRE